MGSTGSVTASYSRRNRVSGVRSQEYPGLGPDIRDQVLNRLRRREYTTQAAHSSLSAAGNGCGSRSETSASVASFVASSGRSDSAPKRQRQFPCPWLGTFTRASLPSPSTSCIGTTQRLATELEAERIIAQLTPSSHRPRYAATC